MCQNNYCAIIVAAGLSSRMGAFKPLLNISGRPALFWLLEAIEGAGIERILVVTGHAQGEINRAVSRYTGKSCIETIHNPNYQNGMLGSVQTGIRRAADVFSAENAAGAALLFPADTPLVTKETILRLLLAFERRAAKRPLALPTYGGKNGHPLLIPNEYFEELLAFDEDGGLKGFRNRHEASRVSIMTNDAGCVLDMDTQEDYEALKAYAAKRTARSQPRIFLVRHGQPAQHDGKIFLGQTDVPLSHRGQEEAAAAGETLLRFGANARRIYTSDLSRARETANILSKKLNGIPVLQGALLREMAMGSWDGELIEEIRRKFPDEYKKRGDDLLNYRIPGGENFYDLRGRVTREFHRIFSEDFREKSDDFGDSGDFEDPGDLVLVAHLGVIVCLCEELLGLSGGEGPRDFPTGSVTMLDAPDWLKG